MAAGQESHLEAADLHKVAAAQHTAAANAHIQAAAANKAAGNAAAAKLDNKAAKQHQEAAAAHTAAATQHLAAAPQGSQRTVKRQNSMTASQQAGAESTKAGTATQTAVEADTDPANQPQANAGQQAGAAQQAGAVQQPDPAAAQAQVTQGQLAQQASNQAVATGSDAAQHGEAAAQVGTSSDGDLINSIVEGLGLNGIPKTMLDHNRYFTFALIGVVIVFVWLFGTEPTVNNPFLAGATKCCPPPPVSRPPGQVTVGDIISQDPDFQPIRPTDYFTQSRLTETDLRTDLDNFSTAVADRMKALQDKLKSKEQQVQAVDQKIEQQEAALASALQAVSALAIASAPASGPIGPLIGIATTLVTAGLGLDNVRKRSKLPNYPGAEVSNT